MKVTITLNGRELTRDIDPGMNIYDFVRNESCYSVKCGCETANCGACTVLLDDEPVLSCSVLAARADGREITTLEGVQEIAAELASFIEAEGADQCGFCNPGFMMNTIALLKKNSNPTEEEVNDNLTGNLCRCSGYQGQTRGIMKYIEHINGKEVL